MIKAIFFDMDGVLVDSYEFWYRLFNFTLKHFKYPEMREEEFNEKIWGISTLEAVQRYLPKNTDKEMAEFYLEKYAEFEKYFRTYPDTISVLKKLKEKKIVIVSNTHMEIAEEELKKCKIRSYVDILLCPNENLKPKPYPDMILEGLRQLKLKKEEAIFVGDTVTDMAAGRAAGIMTIGLRIDGGNRKIDKLEEIFDIAGVR
ncbi:HAD family hydrolase [Candidatus Woesearchaeota archaeon]|nr:HAD family hydrolase [Candidatus Woesearchaeota archaeon]